MTRRQVVAGVPALALAVASVAWAGPAAAQDVSPSDVVVVPGDQSVILERADRARVKGDPEAPIRIVEISDFECPFCARFYQESYRAIDSLYVRSGLARYVWISFPNSTHPRAWPAIEAAFCAGAAGRFWAMHDVLFERREEWGRVVRRLPAQRPDGPASGKGLRVRHRRRGIQHSVLRRRR